MRELMFVFENVQDTASSDFTGQSKISEASIVEPTFAKNKKMNHNNKRYTIILQKYLLMFDCGDRLCCHTGSYVHGCRFQSGPHGCKALTNDAKQVCDRHSWISAVGHQLCTIFFASYFKCETQMHFRCAGVYLALHSLPPPWLRRWSSVRPCPSS